MAATNPSPASYFQCFDILDNSPRYAHLTVNAKYLYGKFRDVLKLSVRNDWQDANGYFIRMSRAAMCQTLRVSEPTVRKILNQLKASELISEKQEGLNKPNRIYVHLIQGQDQNDYLAKNQNGLRSGPKESSAQDRKEFSPNQRNVNQTHGNQRNQAIVNIYTEPPAEDNTEKLSTLSTLSTTPEPEPPQEAPSPAAHMRRQGQPASPDGATGATREASGAPAEAASIQEILANALKQTANAMEQALNALQQAPGDSGHAPNPPLKRPFVPPDLTSGKAPNHVYPGITPRTAKQIKEERFWVLQDGAIFRDQGEWWIHEDRDIVPFLFGKKHREASARLLLELGMPPDEVEAHLNKVL